MSTAMITTLDFALISKAVQCGYNSYEVVRLTGRVKEREGERERERGWGMCVSLRGWVGLKWHLKEPSGTVVSLMNRRKRRRRTERRETALSSSGNFQPYTFGFFTSLTYCWSIMKLVLVLLALVGTGESLKPEWTPGDYSKTEEGAERFVSDYNSTAEEVLYFSTEASWNYNTNLTDVNSQLQGNTNAFSAAVLTLSSSCLNTQPQLFLCLLAGLTNASNSLPQQNKTKAVDRAMGRTYARPGVMSIVSDTSNELIKAGEGSGGSGSELNRSFVSKLNALLTERAHSMLVT
ncbi:hypothetical protein DNTS_013442, partial [Danionella cerebrum]